MTSQRQLTVNIKIEKYGIIGKGKELFQSYIKDRYQGVLIDNKTNQILLFQIGQ